jgi:hypothetical protein
MKIHLLGILVALSLFSRASAAQPEVFEKSEDGGFVDAEFRAQNIKTRPDGSLLVSAISHADSDEVGFEVLVPPRWVEWKPKDYPEVMYRSVVVIKSSGKKTEAFVRALAKAYGLQAPKFEFRAIALTAISLAGDPRKVDSMPVKLKLFCESERAGEYAEIYLTTSSSSTKRIQSIEEPSSDYYQQKRLTSRQSQRRHLSRSLLTQGSRQLPSWLICDVRQE